MKSKIKEIEIEVRFDDYSGTLSEKNVNSSYPESWPIYCNNNEFKQCTDECEFFPERTNFLIPYKIKTIKVLFGDILKTINLTCNKPKEMKKYRCPCCNKKLSRSEWLYATDQSNEIGW